MVASSSSWIFSNAVGFHGQLESIRCSSMNLTAKMFLIAKDGIRLGLDCTGGNSSLIMSVSENTDSGTETSLLT